MPTTVIRYRTRPDRADKNQKLIESVFADLAQAAPAGIGYTALRLADGESFIHIIETTTADNPIADLDAFAAFQADIGDRLAAPPTAAEADVIGTYPIRANGAGHRPLTNDD
jgi:hypothetical protein